MTYLLSESASHELLPGQESRLLEEPVEVDHFCIQGPSKMVEGVLDCVVFRNQVNEPVAKRYRVSKRAVQPSKMLINDSTDFQRCLC